MLTANEIRQQFIDFFVKKHGHTFVPSSSVVPHGDDTLLFSNAGMNQFKDVFLGTGTRPYKRAANTQKCIRAGGKHNDLDDVGRDTYHHTFFEMLGNWSFGDYFKKEAIRWAWQLLTEVWKLDKSRLHATVFEGDPDNGVPPDEEAAALWRSETDINPKQVHWGSKKDNFWEMGETGPCGPCTEIHIDRTPNKTGSKLVNAGRPEAIEIWNLVFIQYNRGEDRKLTPLPAKHVDTGMGFERVTAVLQNKESNYDTDVFQPIFAAIGQITGAPPYGGKLDDLRDVAYRVVADHIRTLTFALTDGARIGNAGRDYVLKRILRRAERYGRMCLGATRPFLCELVPTIVDVMSSPFPELKGQPDKVAATIRDEEVAFIRNFDRGVHLFQKIVKQTKNRGGTVISGDDAFTLHSQDGFYVDITEQMAGEVGMTVDQEGFQRRMTEFQTQSGEGQEKLVVTAITGQLPHTDEQPKYAGLAAEGRILGWVQNNTVVDRGKLTAGDQAALLLDRTCFYAEQGGQVGDRGTIITPTGRFQVEDTQKLGDSVVHQGRVVEGTIECGQAAQLEVDDARADIMRNHTATHLLNWALREVLGDHVEQKGSLVDAKKTRFDFTHNKALTPEEVQQIERLVNEKIYLDLPVRAVTLPLAEAKKIAGVRAVFGEKYPDPVRVLLIGAEQPQQATRAHSVEFCGGTHLQHTGQAGFFKVVGQERVGGGVLRLTAVTGREAVATVQRLSVVVEDLAGRFNCRAEEIPGRVESLQEEIKKLQAQLRKGAATDLAAAGDRLLEAATEINGARVLVGTMPAGPVEQMRQQIDRLRQKAKSAAILIGWVDEDKVQLLASVTEDLSKKLQAGKLMGEVAKVVGGKGGGPPAGIAQGGGKEPGKLAEALKLGERLIREKLGAL
jgi:alanyl-tRNA synthetase